MSKPLFPVYVLWLLVVFDLDLFLSAHTGGPFYRFRMLLVPVLGLLILRRGQNTVLYPPILVFVALHLAASVFAENRGMSWGGFKIILYMLILFAGSVSLLDSPAKVISILKLYLLSFIWFALQGLPNGRVSWHPQLGNEDSFGPLMVMAIPFAYFFASAAVSKGWKWLARGTFLLGVLGLVASFARGAALTGGVVLLYILLRSPHRARTLGALAAGTILLLPIAGALIPLEKYVEELKSVSEGDQGRLDVWMMAFEVFQHSPVWGVGAFNFGVVASQIIEPDAARAKGADPTQIYSLWTHNAPLQILAEEGAIGFIAWSVMLVGFFRRTRKARTHVARARWARRGGRAFDLRAISLGLDGAMLGWLGCSIFYNQLYDHWFWSLLTLSFSLDIATARGSGVAGRPSDAGRRLPIGEESSKRRITVEGE